MITAQLQGFDAILASLRAKPGQINYATAMALHKTAHLARRAGQEEMRTQFDRPTSIVLNSLFVRPSRWDKKRLWAELAVKDVQFGTTITDYSPSVPEPGSMAEKIGHQFTGGVRVKKKLEKELARAGYISSSEFVAPGPDAPLDPRYGNLPAGFTMQVLSALRAQRDPRSNATESKASLRAAKKAGNMFWSSGMDKSRKLRRGLWARSVDGVTPRLFLVVLPKVSYRRRIKLDVIANNVVSQHFDEQFLRAIDVANRTAR